MEVIKHLCLIVLSLLAPKVSTGAVVDVILNNRPGSEGNPLYPDNPSLMMQHPIHLHGHKFWILGVGSGVYNPRVDGSSLNTFNPMLRDTVTLPVSHGEV